MVASIFNTVEFYVITAFIAAAVIAAVAMPSQKGAARTFLYGGTLRSDAAPSEPGIVAIVGDDGNLTIHRFGLDDLGEDGTYSLAVTIIGLDVTIEERVRSSRPLNECNPSYDAAWAVLDCLGPERYHFNYRSEATGRSAAFSLNIRPGNRIERLLS